MEGRWFLVEGMVGSKASKKEGATFGKVSIVLWIGIDGAN